MGPFGRYPLPMTPAKAPPPALSDILKALSEGQSPAAVAASLGVSETWVEVIAGTDAMKARLEAL